MAKSKKPTKPAAKKGYAAQAPEEKIEGALDRTEQFLRDNGKLLLTILAVAVLLVGGYFAYTYLHAHPRADRAANEMFVAEQIFAEGDFETALNGDGNNAGFIEIVDNYGRTRPGRLAAHYAGICYYKLGDMDSALEYLVKYRSAKGATAAVINAQNYGLQGDIYSDMGEYARALDLYNKAVAAGNNILTTPFFLKKSAEMNIQLGNNARAREAYERIKREFGNSVEARDIDKYIGALEQR